MTQRSNALSISRYDLKEFDALIPLLMRCFPDFWEPRLAEGKYSFPYDLELFAARMEDRIMGCIGVHEYPFYLDGRICVCGGVCDVAIDPDFRGRGYSVELQKFFIEYCRKHYSAVSLMPLYTGKPRVYEKQGWQIYESDRSDEICCRDFPEGGKFQFDPEQLSLECLRGEKAPRTQEEEKALRVIKIYGAGKKFNGKVLRSGKTWWELFTDRKHFWHLEEESFLLYRDGSLLEGYSADPNAFVSRFTPKHGGFDDDNKLMVNMFRTENETDRQIAGYLAANSLIFPAADVF